MDVFMTVDRQQTENNNINDRLTFNYTIGSD